MAPYFEERIGHKLTISKLAPKIVLTIKSVVKTFSLGQGQSTNLMQHLSHAILSFLTQNILIGILKYLKILIRRKLVVFVLLP